MFRYSPRMLNHAARMFRANPEQVYRVGPDYFAMTFTATQWFAWFRASLDRKITAADPRTGTGRKWSDDYAQRLARLRPYVGTRLVIEPDRVAGMGPRVASALRRRLRGSDF